MLRDHSPRIWNLEFEIWNLTRLAPAIAVVVMVVSCVTGWAAGTTAAASGTPIDASSSVKATQKADLYDIDASGLDVRLVLEMLARRSGVNIVVSPEVAGDINAHLKQMTVGSILEYLSTVQGFHYEKNGDTFLVAGKDKLDKAQAADPKPPAAPETLVWVCRHVKPADLITMLEKLFPTIKAATGPDSVTPILEQSAGLDMGSGGGGSSSGSSSTTTVNHNCTRVVLIGEASEIAKARDILTQLDAPRAQVEIQVAITEVNSSASKDLGIEWNWTDYSVAGTPNTGIGFGKFNQTGMTITGAISAMIKDGRANLLAQPKVSVLDCETAEILIGDRILYPKLVGYNQVGSPIYDKAEEKVGIYLQIAPKVAGNNEIVMTLYPQVSLVTSYLKTQAGDYPQISTREAKTTVSVRSGTTLAIGGLMQDNEVNNLTKFPILGDLPVLGHLFRHTKKTKDRTEIVILLSPKIVEEK